MRAFDNYISIKEGKRLAYYGVGTALGGGGDKFFKMARLFKKCGYDVCILMDSDLQIEEEQKAIIRDVDRIPVFDWENGNAIEEQLFSDSPVTVANSLLSIAVSNKGFESVRDKLKSKVAMQYLVISENSVAVGENVPLEQKKLVGTVAKHSKSEWFKRIDLGELVGTIVFENYSDYSDTCGLKNTLKSIYHWVTGNEKERT